MQKNNFTIPGFRRVPTPKPTNCLERDFFGLKMEHPSIYRSMTMTYRAREREIFIATKMAISSGGFLNIRLIWHGVIGHYRHSEAPTGIAASIPPDDFARLHYSFSAGSW